MIWVKGGETDLEQDTKTVPAVKPKVRMNSFRRNRRTRAHKESSFWMISPANLRLVIKVIWDLVTVAEMNGQVGLEVTHVRVANVEGETKIYMWPTDMDDPEGLEIKNSGGKRRLNLGAYLEEWNLALPVRTKERFRLSIVEEPKTPDGVPNALMWDMSAPLERQIIKESKKKKGEQKSEQNGQQANSAQAQSTPNSQSTPKAESGDKAESEQKPEK